MTDIKSIDEKGRRYIAYAMLKIELLTRNPTRCREASANEYIGA